MIVFFLQLNCIGRVCFCFLFFPPTFLSGILIIRLHIDIEG